MLDKLSAYALALSYLRTLESVSSTHYAIVDEATVEKSYGWFFIYNSREYVGTGSDDDSIIGARPFFIDRHTGTVQPLNATSLATAIPDYEAYRFWGYKFVLYDIIIQKVEQVETAVNYLEKLRLVKWSFRELPSGAVIGAMRPYTTEELKELISHLPCVFKQQFVRRHFLILQQMSEDISLVCKIVPSEDQNNPMQVRMPTD